jgi:hypothetical protein
VAGIKIALVSDVKSFLAGTKQAEDALGDVSDSLDDVAKDATKAGDKAGDELADGIEGGTKDAEKSVDRLEHTFKDLAEAAGKSAGKVEDSFKDSLDKVEKKAKDTGKDISRSLDEGGAEGLSEMSNEAQSTATEVAASFDGSAESILGGFQELAANAFAGFGPAGAIAGLAIAAGIGTWYTQMTEDTEAAKERITGLADAMIEANSRVLGQDIINDQIKAIATNADEAVIGIEDIRAKNEELGLSETELVRAFAGDADARTVAIRELAEEQQQAREDALSSDAEVMASGSRRDASATALLEQLEMLDGEYQKGADSFTTYNEAVKAGHDEQKGKIHSTIDEYNALHTTIDDLPKTTVTIGVKADLTEAKRQVKAFTDGTYAVTVNGRVAGMRYQ